MERVPTGGSEGGRVALQLRPHEPRRNVYELQQPVQFRRFLRTVRLGRLEEVQQVREGYFVGIARRIRADVVRVLIRVLFVNEAVVFVLLLRVIARCVAAEQLRGPQRGNQQQLELAHKRPVVPGQPGERLLSRIACVNAAGVGHPPVEHVGSEGTVQIAQRVLEHPAEVIQAGSRDVGAPVGNGLEDRLLLPEVVDVGRGLVFILASLTRIEHGVALGDAGVLAPLGTVERRQVHRHRVDRQERIVGRIPGQQRVGQPLQVYDLHAGRSAVLRHGGLHVVRQVGVGVQRHVADWVVLGGGGIRRIVGRISADRLRDAQPQRLVDHHGHRRLGVLDVGQHVLVAKNPDLDLVGIGIRRKLDPPRVRH